MMMMLLPYRGLREDTAMVKLTRKVQLLLALLLLERMGMKNSSVTSRTTLAPSTFKHLQQHPCLTTKQQQQQQE